MPLASLAHIVRGDAMMPSLPCPKCRHVDNLETVNPLGIFLGRTFLWVCECGTTRGVEILHDTPKPLVTKAKDNGEERAARERRKAR